MAVGLLGTREELTRDHVEDVLAPARGIVIGLVLSSILWVLVAFLAMHL